MSIFSFFFPKILEQTSSRFNKKIQIIELFNRRSLRVNGMTQSGSIVEDIYKKIIPLLFNCHCEPRRGVAILRDCFVVRHLADFLAMTSKKCLCKNYNIRNVLILGFGTGTFAKLIKKKHPQAKIIGLEIDKTIIDLGKKYFQTDKINNLKLINSDAIKFVNSHYDTAQYHSSFDIIFVDLYCGEIVESNVEDNLFLDKLKTLLKKNGIVIFNRLNFSSHKDKAQKFKERLEKIFSQVTQTKSYSNIIFLGKKRNTSK